MNHLPSPKQLSRAVKGAAAERDMNERRIRRWIAAITLMEAFNIARARGSLPDYLVKGGFALEFRFQSAARASRDIDIVLPLDADALLEVAIETLRIEWSGFTFRIKGVPERREVAYRLEVAVRYRSTEWSTFDVELAFGSVRASDRIEPLDLSEFGLLRPGTIPCMTAEEQIAQKLHALSDTGENRPRDVIDVVLIDRLLALDDTVLRRYCIETFAARATHVWPPTIELRPGWDVQIADLITRFELPLSVNDAITDVRRLVARLR